MILDPEKPLKFEEDLNDSDDDIDELLPFPSSPPTPSSLSAPLSMPDSSADEGSNASKSTKQIDPNEEIGAGFGREDVDEEDELVPYDLEDDMSDLHPHAKQ